MVVEPKKLDFLDSVRFVFTVIVPQLLRGTLAPSRFWLPILVWLQAGQWSATTIDAFRRKYKSDRLWMKFGIPIVFPRALIVLDGKGMGAVLNSDRNQADPPLKKISLGRFMPHSILISRGHDWEVRRNYNESVLDSKHCRHRDADTFIDIIFGEVEMLSRDNPAREFNWHDFRLLARKISQQVLVGTRQFEPDLYTEVDHLVSRVNWFFLPVWILHPGYLASFYDKIARGLRSASGGSLFHGSADHYPQNVEKDRIRVENQAAFWVFVVRDALELHVTRTLALIAAHPEIQDEIRAALRGAREPDALKAIIDGFDLLEHCVREQLRLWTPIPVLLRTTPRFRLPDASSDIADNQQLLLYPGYYHRDPNVFGHLADQFCPEHVSNSPPTYYFSDGQQRCAGENLALLLVKFTLGALLSKYRFDLAGPRLDTKHIPRMYDHFHVRFRARREVASTNRGTKTGTSSVADASACPARSQRG